MSITDTDKPVTVVASQAATARPRITPNLFGIGFGLAGVAEAWSAAAKLTSIPPIVGTILWVVATVVWVLTLAAYLRDVGHGHRWRRELNDPTFAPFVALVSIVPMLVGAALGEGHRLVGTVIFAIAAVTTLGLGGWLVGQWIITDLSLSQWHPGYFLPTVAGGYLAANGLAELGYQGWGELMFGYGTVSWLVLGSILLQRMFVAGRLPTPLLPTMAIQMAPPVVAGVAWFSLNGERVDALALGLAGYAFLMGMVQLRLVGLYRTVPFGPGWWSFAFSYAAVFVDGLHWLAAEHVAHQLLWSALLLGLLSAAVLTLLAKTVNAIAHGTFLPPATMPAGSTGALS